MDRWQMAQTNMGQLLVIPARGQINFYIGNDSVGECPASGPDAYKAERSRTRKLVKHGWINSFVGVKNNILGGWTFQLNTNITKLSRSSYCSIFVWVKLINKLQQDMSTKEWVLLPTVEQRKEQCLACAQEPK